MKILSFDTSTDKMFVTISKNEKVVTSKVVTSTKDSYNSAFLIPTIVELLKTQSLTMEDIEAIGVNIGPGSFTGIRASAVVARVIGQQLNIPVVGVSSMEIYSVLNKTEKNTLVLMDARRGKAYFAVYDKKGKPINEPSAYEYEEAYKEAQSGNYFVISDKRLSKQLDELKIEHIIFEESNYKFGDQLAKLTAMYINENTANQHNWALLKPLYIQPPPISAPKKQA